MMIWALGRRNNEVVWRPYRLKMGDHLKGSMPPSIGHMELLVCMQRADFSEHIC